MFKVKIKRIVDSINFPQETLSNKELDDVYSIMADEVIYYVIHRGNRIKFHPSKLQDLTIKIT